MRTRYLRTPKTHNIVKLWYNITYKNDDHARFVNWSSYVMTPLNSYITNCIIYIMVDLKLWQELCLSSRNIDMLDLFSMLGDFSALDVRVKRNKHTSFPNPMKCSPWYRRGFPNPMCSQWFSERIFSLTWTWLKIKSQTPLP